MLEETIGRNERRATAVVVTVLIVEALWALLHKYLPLDAGLWALQADLVHSHLSTNVQDGWRLIPYPSANIAAPLGAGLLSFLLSPEIAVRLLLVLVGLLGRGLGFVVLFRVLKVRDEAIYYLIPVVVGSGLWFGGALPYLTGETIAIWTLAYFFAQDRPRGSAFGILSFGLALAALAHALAFAFAALVVLAVTREQKRSVHLSQGWLSSSKSVMSLLVPGLAIVALSFFTGQPVFTISTSGFLPDDPLKFLVFLWTPVPDILEATFNGGVYIHAIFSVALAALWIACFVRALLLAIEEPTWQSRSIKTAGFLVMILALASPLIRSWNVETSAWIGVATLALLGGHYSRGPAVRRSYIDRALLTLSMCLMVGAGLINGFSINRGSEAALDVMKTSTRLISALRPFNGIRMVVDSSVAQTGAANWVGTFSYSATSPLYLFQSTSVLATPQMCQPRAGIVRMKQGFIGTPSPARPLELPSMDRYLDSTNRVFAVLPNGASTSPTFGRFEFSLVDTIGASVSKGEAKYRLLVGKLSGERPVGYAARQ